MLVPSLRNITAQIIIVFRFFSEQMSAWTFLLFSASMQCKLQRALLIILSFRNVNWFVCVSVSCTNSSADSPNDWKRFSWMKKLFQLQCNGMAEISFLHLHRHFSIFELVTASRRYLGQRAQIGNCLSFCDIWVTPSIDIFLIIRARTKSDFDCETVLKIYYS